MADFLDSIYEFIENTEQTMEDVLQTTTVKVAESAINLSPVDTGRFKGNWQLGINTPTTSSLLRYDKDGHVTLSDISSKSNGLRIGDQALIENHVLYGEDLEYGSSKQSEDMVRISAMRFPRIVEEAVSQHRRS